MKLWHEMLHDINYVDSILDLSVSREGIETDVIIFHIWIGVCMNWGLCEISQIESEARSLISSYPTYDVPTFVLRMSEISQSGNDQNNFCNGNSKKCSDVRFDWSKFFFSKQFLIISSGRKSKLIKTKPNNRVRGSTFSLQTICSDLIYSKYSGLNGRNDGKQSCDRPVEFLIDSLTSFSMWELR